jgi:hypothetical protein
VHIRWRTNTRNACHSYEARQHRQMGDGSATRTLVHQIPFISKRKAENIGQSSALPSHATENAKLA